MIRFVLEKTLMSCKVIPFTLIVCPVGFKGATKTYKDSIRTKSSLVFRNYDSSECAEICRDSPGCESFLYRQDMKWEDQKDEENGCFLYYQSSEVPANQFKRIGPKVQSYNEIACEKLSYQSKYQNSTVFPIFTNSFSTYIHK